MNFLEKIFIKLHNLVSRKEEESKLSAGFLPPRIRGVVENLCIDKKGYLLDVGCGEGLFLISLAKSFPSFRIIGIDNYKDILKEAKERLREAQIEDVSILLADAKLLPFKNNYFDTVVCLNMLYNLSSKRELCSVIKEMVRVCKNSGSIIFDVRNKLNPLIYFGYKLRKYYDTSSSWTVNAYRLKEIINILEGEGFKIKQKITIGFPSGIFAPVVVIEAHPMEHNKEKI